MNKEEKSENKDEKDDGIILSGRLRKRTWR